MHLTHHFCIGDAAVALEGAGVLGGLDVPAATAAGSGVGHGPRSEKRRATVSYLIVSVHKIKSVNLLVSLLLHACDRIVTEKDTDILLLQSWTRVKYERFEVITQMLRTGMMRNFFGG